MVIKVIFVIGSFIAGLCIGGFLVLIAEAVDNMTRNMDDSFRWGGRNGNG